MSDRQLIPDGPGWMFPVDENAAEYFWRVVINPKDKNFLGKPQPTREDKAKKLDAKKSEDRGQAVASDGIPPWDRPRFDLGKFATASPDSQRDDEGLVDQFNIVPTSRGAAISATWQGANVGAVSARVATKTGAGWGYEDLICAAQTTPDEFREHIMSNPLFYFRWGFARITYGDTRWHGKARCGPDITYEQAACEKADEALYDFLRAFRLLFEQRGGLCEGVDVPPSEDWWIIPLIDEVIVLKSPVLGFFVLWLAAFFLDGLLNRELQRKNIHAYRRGLAPFHHAPRPDRDEEKRLARRYQAGDVIAGNIIIAAHIWIARDIAGKYQDEAERDDLIQEGTFGLYKALRKFDPESRYRFSTLAYRAVEWAIDDYLETQRRLGRHESTDEITGNGASLALGMYRAVSVEPEIFFD